MSDQYGEFAEPEQLEVDDVDDVLDEETGEVDVEALSAKADRLEELHDELRAQLVGQDQPPQQ